MPAKPDLRYGRPLGTLSYGAVPKEKDLSPPARAAIRGSIGHPEESQGSQACPVSARAAGLNR